MRAWLCIAALVMLRAPAADACGCVYPYATVLPVDGTQDAPVNTAIAIVRTDWTRVPITIEVHDVSTAASLPVDVVDHGTWLRVNATYEPNHDYEVVVSGFEVPLRSTFRTGSDVDTTPPVFAGLSSVAFELMKWPVMQPDGTGCTGDCFIGADGFLPRVIMEFADPSPDMQLLVYEQVHDGIHEEIVAGFPWKIRHRLASDGGGEACSPLPILKRETTYCARLIAYDMAGNTAGEAVEQCGEPVECRGQLARTGDCLPSHECLPPEPPLVVTTESSGCQAGGGRGWALLLLMLLRRRRRAY